MDTPKRTFASLAPRFVSPAKPIKMADKMIGT